MILLRSASMLVMLLLLLAPSPGAAQARMSIVGGLAASELSDEGGEGLGSRKGVHIGAFGEVPLLGGWLSFLPGGHYIEKGFSSGEAISVKLSYFEIMAPLRVGLPMGEKLSVHAFAGPGFAMEMGCVFKEIDDNIQRTFDCHGSDFQFKGHDVTGVVGMGAAVVLSPRLSIVLSGAMDRSLISISSASSDATLRNRTWLISGGVSYPLARR
jgi:hypothetical protein